MPVQFGEKRNLMAKAFARRAMVSAALLLASLLGAPPAHAQFCRFSKSFADALQSEGCGSACSTVAPHALHEPPASADELVSPETNWSVDASDGIVVLLPEHATRVPTKNVRRDREARMFTTPTRAPDARAPRSPSMPVPTRASYRPGRP